MQPVSGAVQLPVDATFDLRYQPRTTDTGEGEREIEEDDLTTAFYDDDNIDLGELMREQFYLALPMKPLCRDDCHGLCAQCGTNLNRDAVRLRARVGRSAARGAEGAARRQSGKPVTAFHVDRADSERPAENRRCLIQNDDTPRPGRPSAGPTTR